MEHHDMIDQGSIPESSARVLAESMREDLDKAIAEFRKNPSEAAYFEMSVVFDQMKDELGRARAQWIVRSQEEHKKTNEEGIEEYREAA